MGYLATNIARIPSEGFDYFLFLLEDDWSDDLRREFAENFDTLAKEVGTDTLVIRGSDRTAFSYAIFEAYDLDMHTVLPALFITDTAPNKIGEGTKKLANAKAIVISLENQYTRPGSVTKLLRHAANTLRDKEAIESLKSLDRSRIEQRWGWLRYFELKPNFVGFGLNINQIVEKMLLTP